MNKSRIFRLFALVLLVCLAASACELMNATVSDGELPPLVGTPDGELADNACYLYTPQMVEDTFKYLDEIYIEKYPEMALRWEHGTGADQRIITAVAQQITAGCTTDVEKVNAIYKWIVDNITYGTLSSPFSFDVLYGGVGNCLGKTMLMRDLCRTLGIPAEFSVGWRGYMSSLAPKKLLELDGHAWCFVYLDGEWVLYDPTWGTAHLTDRDQIAKEFYINSVGGVTPVYDEKAIPPLVTLTGAVVYAYGSFFAVSPEGPATQFIASSMNYALDLYHYGCDTGWGGEARYLDGAGAFIYLSDHIESELFTKGWFTTGNATGFSAGDVHYLYENGFMASNVVIEHDGISVFFDHGVAYELSVPQQAYMMKWGNLYVDKSYQGQIWNIYSGSIPVESEYELYWSTSNPSVATVDENGVVTCHGEGEADIICTIVYTNRVDASYNGGGERNFELTVYFDDIYRPDEYAVLDQGGPSGADTELSLTNDRDIYPIITDDIVDMLMGSAPEYGEITLPSAQNANGYFIMPDTYENMRSIPYDFILPLADGSIVLDHNALAEFTLVNTEQWGEMWYLPLNEDGVGVFDPSDDAPDITPPEESVDIYFGTPTADIQTTMGSLMDFMFIDQPIIDGTVTSRYTEKYDGVSVGTDVIKLAIDMGCSLQIPLLHGAVTLDQAAMSNLVESRDNSDLWFMLLPLETEWCEYGQQPALNKLSVVDIYWIYCIEYMDGSTINDLKGGTATVTVPLENNGGTYGVYFVDGIGNLTEVPSSVNGNTITFEAPYLSTYAIVDIAVTPIQ
ncbi:MAG: hypothetical protein J6W15_04195 [Clostridia bacterium]|nr:hypothetical protein [Clostridia bacterium]